MQDEFEEASDGQENDEKQSVSSDLIRGHINTIILRALYEGDRYGYEIISEIERKSHGQYTLKQPSLYSALKRLEKEGYITSYWGGSVSGGRRKYFSLTEEGKKISELNQSEWEYSRTVIDSLISDKDFDFSNPAPGLVNMRVLRESTTRTPASGDSAPSPAPSEPSEDARKLMRELEEQREELNRRQERLAEQAEHLEREREAFKQLSESREGFDEEQTTFAESASRLDEVREALDEEAARLELERRRFEEEMNARNDALLRERAWREHEIAEREKQLEAEKKALEEKQSRMNEEEFRALDERLREQEEALCRQRALYEEELEKRDRELLEERRSHAEELERREQQIIEEQETAFRQREQQLLHKNYLDLIATPPTAEEEKTEYTYTSAPVGEQAVDTEPAAEFKEEDPFGYRGVVRRIYANSLYTEPDESPKPEPVRTERATSLDGINLADIEERGAQEGLRVVTAGGKSKTQIVATSISLTNRGRALFISSVVLFLFCVVLGSVILGMRSSLSLPVYFPYLIWAVALVVLLVCGLAYANKYGERSLRHSTLALVNAVVLFILLIVLTLIVALWAKIDFTDINDVATFIIFPILFFFGIVIFGSVYYVLVRPNQD